MKKKILALCLVVALAATAVIGGTLAYFTDTDSNVNVMTVGNVKIDQIEQQRTTDGNTLEQFQDSKKLAPYTGPVGNNGIANQYTETATVNGNDEKMFSRDDNAVDKIVTVTNTGTEECYVRTLFAFEMEKIVDKDGNVTYQCPAASKYNRLGLAVGGNGGMKGGIALKGDTDTNSEVIIEVDGVKYRVGEFYYNNDSKLAKDETTHPSLKQIYLNAKVDNEWYDHVGAEYSILVVSQAVQTQGFDDAVTALNTAFGDINEMYKTTEGKAELTSWFTNTPSHDISAES